MITPASGRQRIQVTITTLVAVLLILPWLAQAQAGVDDAASSTATSDTSTVVDQTPVPAAASVYAVTPLPGNGQVLGDFVVGPGKVELTLNPGESKTINLSVSNRTGETKRFNVTAEDAVGSMSTDQTIVLLGDDRGPYSMKEYVSVPAASFTLEHNHKASVPVTITVPADAEPGGLYGSVLIDTVAVEGEPATDSNPTPRSAVVSRIGTLFFITVPGDVETAGEVVDFMTVPAKHWYTRGPITFGLTFENTGSIHLTPSGELRVYNLFGEEVGSATLDPWFVLPHAIRLREITWQREFLFGRYTAVATIDRGYDGASDRVELSFYVIPWKLVVVILIGLFILIWLMRRFFNTFEFRRKNL